MSPCRQCLRRRWLLKALTPHLERVRGQIDSLVALGDSELLAAVGGQDREALAEELNAFDAQRAEALVEAATATGLELICRHDDGYPEGLGALPLAPMLSVNGSVKRLAELCSTECVAIVGTRRASEYGTHAAEEMAQGLSAAGITVISGMAFGIDSAAHEGALLAGGRTVAVLAGCASTPTPKGKAKLFRRLLEAGGVVISEQGPRTPSWRWMLQARNRIIAGLAAVTVLIEGAEQSGAMITVRHAAQLERGIGALPGPVGVPQAAGPNRLLAKSRAGGYDVSPGLVTAVRDAQDVVDLIYGEGIVEVTAQHLRAAPTASEAELLARVQRGTLTNMAMVGPGEVSALIGLELKGWLRRGVGGALILSGG